MLKKILWMAVIGLLWTISGYAQDISGDWQGTLTGGPKPLRLILHVAKADQDGWTLKVQSIDEGDPGIIQAATSVSLRGSNFNFTIDAIKATYEGKLNPKGTSISGTWSQRTKLALRFERATNETAWRDLPPYTAQLIAVDKDVKLEVLDWGGKGRPLVFLAGLGNTAHVFDKFAPKFIDQYHVYGITRRGFGGSSVPATGYSADRLGDDVVAVLDALKLDKPVLVGHSIAGEELSSVATRHRDRVAGLVYLDAAYNYAYYDANGDFRIDGLDLLRKLETLLRPYVAQDSRQLIQDLLETTIPQFQKDLQAARKNSEGMAVASVVPPPPTPVIGAIQEGFQKYTDIRVPVLAIYAVPKDLGPAAAFGADESKRAALEANDAAVTEAQAKRFETGVPGARVVRLPHANHLVFLSNEADVLREMHTFLDGLH